MILAWLRESLCSSGAEELCWTLVYTCLSSHPSSSLGFGGWSPICYYAGNSPSSEHHLMKPPAADHYCLFLMCGNDAELKSPLLSLMSSVQCLLCKTTCSKPHRCCTRLHNSGFKSCHVGVHALSALEEAQIVPCNSLCFKALGNIKACPSPMSAVTSYAHHWNTHSVWEKLMIVEGESTLNVNKRSPLYLLHISQSCGL